MSFIDEYSRYVVHHEILTGMDGISVSLAAQTPIGAIRAAGSPAGHGPANPPAGDGSRGGDLHPD